MKPKKVKATKETPKSQGPDEPDRVYCLCKRSTSFDEMIECAECKKWYHISCVDISKEEFEHLETSSDDYKCLFCGKKGCQRDLEKAQHEIEDLEEKLQRKQENAKQWHSMYQDYYSRCGKLRKERAGLEKITRKLEVDNASLQKKLDDAHLELKDCRNILHESGVREAKLAKTIENLEADRGSLAQQMAQSTLDAEAQLLKARARYLARKETNRKLAADNTDLEQKLARSNRDAESQLRKKGEQVDKLVEAIENLEGVRAVLEQKLARSTRDAERQLQQACEREAELHRTIQELSQSNRDAESQLREKGEQVAKLEKAIENLEGERAVLAQKLAQPTRDAENQVRGKRSTEERDIDTQKRKRQKVEPKQPKEDAVWESYEARTKLWVAYDANANSTLEAHYLKCKGSRFTKVTLHVATSQYHEMVVEVSFQYGKYRQWHNGRERPVRRRVLEAEASDAMESVVKSEELEATRTFECHSLRGKEGSISTILDKECKGLGVRPPKRVKDSYEQMLEREAAFAGEFAVFYHLYSSKVALLYEVQTCIADVLGLLGQSYNATSCVLPRIHQPQFATATELWEEHRSSDLNSAFQDAAISAVPSLFTSHNDAEASPVEHFQRGYHSDRRIDQWSKIESVMELACPGFQWGEFQSAVSALAKKHGLAVHPQNHDWWKCDGHIMQVFIKNDHLAEALYLSGPYGRPHRTRSIASLADKNKVSRIQVRILCKPSWFKEGLMQTFSYSYKPFNRPAFRIELKQLLLEETRLQRQLNNA